jgi:hypothetical protein
MSKSLGNFFTVRDVLQKYDPEVLRFFILRAHYRSPLSYSDAHLEDAKQALSRLYTALKNAPAGKHEIDWTAPEAARFKEAMDDDFGTPEAIAVLHELANQAFQARPSAAAQLKALGGLLGILQSEPEKFLRSHVVRRPEAHLADAKVEELLDLRAKAKANRDFGRADALRRELTNYGVVVEDSGASRTWRRASMFRLIGLAELEDWRAEAIRFGYDPRDFGIKEFPQKTPEKGVYAMRGDIELKYEPTQTTHRFNAGHGASWVMAFSKIAQQRGF